jgi:glyoxylase-like metal-dependent hydrolase (beta-lactamase superfamily II)
MIREWSTGTVELASGVFARIQSGGGLCIANAGIITGSATGATVIDAMFTPSMTRALLDETRRVAGTSRIERLVNTHHHVDHTLGNALFPSETEILAHTRTKSEMERTGLGPLDIIARIAPHFGDELQSAQQRLPDATFDGDALELEIAGRVVRLLHFGTAHTRGDVLVHLPAERILFAGDVGFFFVTPLAFEGHIGKWAAVIRRVLTEVDADAIVPGHGPVGTKDNLLTLAAYFDLVRRGARIAFDAGASVQEAAASIDLVEFADWTESERIIPNVARLYQEFRGELDGF